MKISELCAKTNITNVQLYTSSSNLSFVKQKIIHIINENNLTLNDIDKLIDDLQTLKNKILL